MSTHRQPKAPQTQPEAQKGSQEYAKYVWAIQWPEGNLIFSYNTASASPTLLPRSTQSREIRIRLEPEISIFSTDRPPRMCFRMYTWQVVREMESTITLLPRTGGSFPFPYNIYIYITVGYVWHTWSCIVWIRRQYAGRAAESAPKSKLDRSLQLAWQSTFSRISRDGQFKIPDRLRGSLKQPPC